LFSSLFQSVAGAAEDQPDTHAPERGPRQDVGCQTDSDLEEAGRSTSATPGPQVPNTSDLVSIFSGVRMRACVCVCVSAPVSRDCTFGTAIKSP
jgi:hypothetical protein